MLSDNSVKEKLGTSIHVRYMFLPDVKGKYEQLACEQDAVPSNKSAYEHLLKYLVRDRIGLTLGPLVRRLSEVKVDKKHRFKGHDHIFNMASAAGKYSLAPGETVVTFSNEQVQLANGLAGFILSRVQNYDQGLLLTSSYVDSGWMGLLKLHITNVSKAPIVLQTGKEVARLFLFGVDEHVSTDSLLLAKETSHFGSTWSNILSNANNPFEVYAHESPTSGLKRVRALCRMHSMRIALWTALGALSTMLTISHKSISDAYQTFQHVKEFQSQILRADSILEMLNDSAVLRGKQDLSFGTGESKKTVIIPLRDAKITAGAVILTKSQPDLFGETITTSIIPNLDGYELYLTCVFKNPILEDTELTISWIVVP